MGVCSTHNLVTLNSRVSHLTNDVLVGQTDDQAVFRGVVLVFHLNDEPLTSVIVGFTLPAPLEFDLKPLEVLLVFYHFHEPLK